MVPILKFWISTYLFPYIFPFKLFIYYIFIICTLDKIIHNYIYYYICIITNKLLYTLFIFDINNFTSFNCILYNKDHFNNIKMIFKLNNIINNNDWEKLLIEWY